MTTKIEDGYIKASSDNLPVVDAMMMAFYFRKGFLMCENRGQKMERSQRDLYGDQAIGWVQLKRDDNMCVVKGRITPEHSVKNAYYNVTAIVDEREQEVISCECHNCAASQGGCKHAIAFLAWIHRRSEEVSVTSTECYWRKSVLSTIGTGIKFIKVEDFGRNASSGSQEAESKFLDEVASHLKEAGIRDIQLSQYVLKPLKEESHSIHALLLNFKECFQNGTPEDFLQFSAKTMEMEACLKISKLTVSQSDCPLWHEIRYGRITASKVYAAANCKTLDGSLVESVLGAKIKSSEAMRRGLNLEKDVIKLLKQKDGLKIKKAGFFLNNKYPIFGASPDGLGEDFIVEIKCPISNTTKISYFDNGRPAQKHFAQMQLQMLLTDKKKGLYCVCDPEFESNKRIIKSWVEFDADYCKDVLEKAKKFWCKAIFTKLINN